MPAGFPTVCLTRIDNAVNWHVCIGIFSIEQDANTTFIDTPLLKVWRTAFIDIAKTTFGPRTMNSDLRECT